VVLGGGSDQPAGPDSPSELRRSLGGVAQVSKQHRPALIVAEVASASASDACAVESRPAWRCLPGSDHAVPVDEVLDALSALDNGPSAAEPPYRLRPTFGKLGRRPMIRPVDPGSTASHGRHYRLTIGGRRQPLPSARPPGGVPVRSGAHAS
jgi:hypothetical protein